jgi:FixJ family two-component response regulator
VDLLSKHHDPLIAVVDDHESVRIAIGSLLRSFDFKVEVFASAEEFLRHARIGAIAFIVLDVRMPGMSGFDLLRSLRARGLRVPTIFISAHDDPTARRQAFKAGALAFLAKPFPESSLIEPIRSALGLIRTENPQPIIQET